MSSVYDFQISEASNSTTGGWNTAEGQDPSTVNDGMRAAKQLFAGWFDDLGGVVTVGGTGDAQTVTLAEGMTALATGMVFGWKAPGTNTGAATAALTNNAATLLGTKKIRRKGDTACQAGDMVSGGFYLFRYDAAYDGASGALVLLNPEASVTSLDAEIDNLQSNMALAAIKIADLEGIRLNMAGGIADAYDSETDVDTVTSTNEVYDATNDLYSPAPVAISKSTTAAATNTTSGTTMNMGTLSIGTAASDRDVIVTGATRWGSNATISGVTIGGVSATMDVNPSGVSRSAWVARLRVTTGTTAEIIVSSATSMTHTGIQVYRMVGASTASPVTDTSASNSTPVTLTKTVSAGGAAFGSQIDDSTDTTGLAFTAGLTEDVEQALNGTFVRAAHGSLATSTALTSQAFTATRSGARGSATSSFSIAIYEPSSVDNMTLVSNAFTATAVPTTARIAAFIDPQVSMTINTDFTAEASRDGGTTWTAATLALASNPVGTVEQYEGTATISAQPSGSSMKYRLKTLNNKDIDVTGIVYQWS